MRFSVLHTSLLALAAVANAQSYANVVNSLQALASKATNLIAPAEQLSLTNAPLLLIGGGPWAKVISGLKDIYSTATGIASTLGKNTFKDEAAYEIATAFKVQVRVMEDLVRTLTGKKGLLALVPSVGAPVATALRKVESAVDKLALTLIDSVQGPGKKVLQSSATELDASLQGAIKVYSPDEAR